MQIHSKTAFGFGSRYGESEIENKPPRSKNEELLETWYNQVIERHRASKPLRLSSADQESEKRTPEEMSASLKLAVKHKKRCLAFKEDQYVGYGNPLLENASQNPYSVLDDSSSIDHEASFFPETMFTLNCVPDSALPPMNRVQDDQKVFSQLLSCHIRKLGSSLKCSIFLECSHSCSHSTRNLFDYPNKYRDKCIHRSSKCSRFSKCSKLPNPRMCHFSNSSR